MIIQGSLLKNALKDVAVYLPGKFLPALTTLITLPIIARLLSPEEYGVLAVVGIITSLGVIVLANWLTASALRFLPFYRRQNSLQYFYSSLLAAYFISSGLIVAIGAGVWYCSQLLLSESVRSLLPHALIIVLFSSLFSILQTMFRAEQMAKAFVAYELYSVYSSLIIGLLLVKYFEFGVSGMLWGIIFASSTASFMAIFAFYRTGVRFNFHYVSSKILVEFATFGFPGLAATLGTWILMFSDRYFIEFFGGHIDVGLYSMAYTIADRSIGLLVSSMIMATGPILTNTWESDRRAETPFLLAQLTRFAVIVLVPMVAVISMLSKRILVILATQEYSEAFLVIPWVSMGAALYGLSLLAYTGLNLAKKMNRMAFNYLFAGLINVVLNVLFIPAFGYVAAAVTTTVSYLLLLIFNAKTSSVYVHWSFPWKTFARSLFSALPLCLTIGWVTNHFGGIASLIISIPIGMTCYGLFLLLAGEFDSAERKKLKSLAI